MACKKHLFWAAIFVAFSSVNSRMRRGDMKNINFRQKEKQILDEILGPKRYDSRIRPAGSINNTNAPALININMYVRSISRIDDVKMEYSVQITFREDWIDPRLLYDDYQGKLKYLTLTDPTKVWMPDTFFQNEKMGHFHNIIVPNVYIRIFPTGKVLYSIRISLTLSCPMDLKLYPLDRQQCEMRVASYGWTTDDLIYQWKAKDPVQIVPDLNLPRFKLESFLTDYCNTKTNTGEYSCLLVTYYFKRQFSYYLITIYIPCCMLVVVSWVSFWLDPNAVPARVSLAVTTLLTMSTQTSSINSQLPPVAYVKAIDIWCGVCVYMVLVALLEYALVNYAARSDKRRYAAAAREQNSSGYTAADSSEASRIAHQASALRHNRVMQVEVRDTGSGRSTRGARTTTRVVHLHDDDQSPLLKRCYPNGPLISGSMSKNSPAALSWFTRKFPSRSKRIDVLARILFPLIFAVFNLSYWTYYLSVERKIK